MAFPTNKKITEKQIRNLVSESNNPINPLNMTFTYEYVASIVTLNWNDINFAIKNNFLVYQTAIEHALVELQKNESQLPEVMELACILQSELEFKYDVVDLVSKLATPQRSEDNSNLREKFLYVSLNWVYEHKDDYCNPIEVIDILCDETNYPDEVKNLVSFMPTLGTGTKSDSMTERQLSKLLRFLENQRKRWI